MYLYVICIMLRLLSLYWAYIFTEGDDCEIQFAESVLLPAAQAYRKNRPDYDPNYDDPDDILQFYVALDVSTNIM